MFLQQTELLFYKHVILSHLFVFFCMLDPGPGISFPTFHPHVKDSSPVNKDSAKLFFPHMSFILHPRYYLMLQ